MMAGHHVSSWVEFLEPRSADFCEGLAPDYFCITWVSLLSWKNE